MCLWQGRPSFVVSCLNCQSLDKLWLWLVVVAHVPDEGQDDEDQEGGGQDDLGPFVQASTTVAGAGEAVEAKVLFQRARAVVAAVVPTEQGLVVEVGIASCSLQVREALVDPAHGIADARHAHAVGIAHGHLFLGHVFTFLLHTQQVDDEEEC